MYLLFNAGYEHIFFEQCSSVEDSDLYKSKENKVRINIMAFFTYNVLYESSTDRLEKLGLMLPFNNGIKIIF